MSSMDTTREYGENSLPEDTDLVDVVDLSEIPEPQPHSNGYSGPMTK